MPRPKRLDIKDKHYHVINRANARLKLFFEEEDYQTFELVLIQALEMFNIDLLAYCVMPNHFHLVVHTNQDGQMSQFMKWLTQTHTLRWHSKQKTLGTGSLYQGRYKSFIIQEDHHLLTVLRYVERNPLTANLIKNPLNWKYSSLYRRYRGTKEQRKILSNWPIQEPKDYLNILKTPLTPKEIERIEQSERKGKPFGDDGYQEEMIEKYDLKHTSRGVGRPKKD